jgi:hypothetical protein
MTLKEGDDMDSYRTPSPEADAIRDDWRRVSDSYLEQYHCGMTYVDQQSWLFYLPAFLSYSLRHPDTSALPLDACLNTLRPPDREPSRFKMLNDVQREIVRTVLDYLAFYERAVVQDSARLVLEEYWIENPLYGDAWEQSLGSG